jgi:hypothetical protein
MGVKILGNGGLIDSADTYIIGDASQAFVGTYAIQLIDNSMVGTVIVKARSRASGLANTVATAFVEIPYLPLNVNGTVVAYATGSDADITEGCLILVPATGLTIALDCTAYTSGNFRAYVQPVAGAAC